MKKHTLLIAALIAVLSLFATACGDDGGSFDASSPFVQAIVDDIIADEADAISTDRGEVECYVAGVVGRVGEDRLRALGVSETNVQDLDELDLSEAEAGEVVDALFDCIDTQALLAESFADDFAPDEAECLAGKFDEDTLRAFFTATFNDSDAPPDIFGQLFEFMADCGISLEG